MVQVIEMGLLWMLPGKTRLERVRRLVMELPVVLLKESLGDLDRFRGMGLVDDWRLHITF